MTGSEAYLTHWYRRYLRKHVAILPSLSRSSFVDGLIKAYDAISVSQRTQFQNIVDSETNNAVIDQWFADIRTDPDLSTIYHGRPGFSTSQQSYKRTPVALLTFMRHFFAHIFMALLNLHEREFFEGN